jgi:hypothetical protein
MPKLMEKQGLVPGREFDRRARLILAEAQKTLMPDHALETMCINVETGEYVLGKTSLEAEEAFDRRWPRNYYFQIRVDGGPVFKFHGM